MIDYKFMVIYIFIIGKRFYIFTSPLEINGLKKVTYDLSFNCLEQEI